MTTKRNPLRVEPTVDLALGDGAMDPFGRKLLGALVAVLLLFIPQPGSSETPISVGTLSVAGDPIDGFWQRFRTNLEEDPSAEFALKLFIRGELGGEEALMSAVRRGRVQMGSFTVSGMSAVVPEFALLRSPYLFSSEDELDFILDHFLSEPLWALAEKVNLQVLGWLDDGWMSLYAQDAVVSPDDLMNYPMRAWQILASRLFFEALDADTAFMPFPDVVPSLQTGLIKGSEMAPMTYSAIGLVDHAPHFVLTRHSYNTGVVVANKRWLDSLGAADRRTLRAAIPDKSVVRAMFRDNLSGYFESMREQGAIVHTLDDEALAEWKAATRGVHQRLLRQLGPAAIQLDEIIRAGKTAYSKRHP